MVSLLSRSNRLLRADAVEVWSFDRRLRLVHRRVVGVESAGLQETWTVRFASGREVEVPDDGEFLSLDGWIRLDGVQVGYRIGVPRRVFLPTCGLQMYASLVTRNNVWETSTTRRPVAV